jgi:hypothetical protein
MPKAQGFRVIVSGLPERLMTEPMLLAMVENAISKQDVVNIDVKTAYSQGRAMIECGSHEAASRLVAHCDGRNWNANGAPVTAWMHKEEATSYQAKTTMEPERPGSYAVKGMANTQALFNSFTHLPKESPAYVHLLSDTKEVHARPNSEASTNVSDSELDESERSGRPKAPWYPIFT